MKTSEFRIMAAFGFGLLALVIVVFLVISAPSTSHASPLNQVDNPCGDGFQINIIPSLPTQNDTVTVTYSAGWSHIPTPEHQFHQVMGDVIRMDAIYYMPEVFLPVMWWWGGEAGIDNLPSGIYTVQVYLTTVMMGSAFPPELCGTKSFIVWRQEPLQTYLPLIAK